MSACSSQHIVNPTPIKVSSEIHEGNVSVMPFRCLFNISSNISQIASCVILCSYKLLTCGIAIHEECLIKKWGHDLKTFASWPEHSSPNDVNACQRCGSVCLLKLRYNVRKHAKIGLYWLMWLFSCHF